MSQSIVGKTCAECKRWKYLFEFKKKPPSQRGSHYPRCKPCHSAKRSVYRKSIYKPTPRTIVRMSDEERLRRNRERCRRYRKEVRDGPEYRAERRRQERERRASLPKNMQDLRRKYGITPDDKQAMIDAQNGRCANKGCRRILATHYDAKMDHCHKTGKIRGILCNGCNITLGFASDSEKWLAGLIDYLKIARKAKYDRDSQTLVGRRRV